MTPEALAQLHQAAFAPSRGWSVDEFDALCRASGVLLFTRAKGFALARTVTDEIELLTLAVHPDARRQGIADGLMRDWLCDRSERSAFLEVAADNHAALALYAKHGFSVIGRRKGYYRRAGVPSVDALLMQASLTQGQTPEYPPTNPKTS